MKFSQTSVLTKRERWKDRSMTYGEHGERGENSVEVETREPLIREKTGTDRNGDVGEEVRESGGRHAWMVYLSTCVAVCGSYEFGACAGYSSPTQSAITEDLGLSTAEYSLFGSILTFGAMIGAITSGPIADFIGRKGAMRVYGAFCVAGWVAIYFAQGALALDLGRLAGGYGMGAFSYVVPVYIAEIAPMDVRGALTTLNQVMICAGVSVAYILGVVLTWRALALTGLVPCALLILGLFFIPESPRWLAKKGAQKEFEAALQKLRGKDVDITSEAVEIQNYIEELQLLPKTGMLDLFQRRYRRSIIVHSLSLTHVLTHTHTRTQGRKYRIPHSDLMRTWIRLRTDSDSPGWFEPAPFPEHESCTPLKQTRGQRVRREVVPPKTLRRSSQ